MVRDIVREAPGAVICGLARSVQGDIDRCIDAGVDMVHVFIPTSPVQRTHTIRKTHEEVCTITGDIIEYARDHTDQVLFSAMDATRTPIPELQEVFRAAIDAGATAINVPDTVGVATPSMMKSLIETLRSEISCTIDVHCHNDFSMAVANTISAVEGGGDQVQVTINGIGERAGNADIASVVMILETMYGCNTGIDTTRIVETSRLISRYSGIPIIPTHPIIGDNAFSHESGIHSQGVLEESSTFEPGIMTPEMVGHRRRLKLGKHVGRHAIKEMLGQAQIYPDVPQIDEIMVRIKQIAAKGRQVTDNDLYVIAESVMGRKSATRIIELDDILITTGNHSIPTATVKAMVNGKETICCHTGDGPIDAAMKAILGIAPTGVHLKDFGVQAISGGTDAIAHVTIAVENDQGQVYDAGASGEDVVIASAEAMVQALNIVSRMDATRKQELD